MLISTCKSFIEDSVVAPGGPDVVDILQKVNKILLLKENQDLSIIRFQTYQLYLKTYYNNVHIKLYLCRDMV